MEKIIFFGLVIPIFAFVLYLGVSAIMKGSEAKSALKEKANLKNDEDENSLYDKTITQFYNNLILLRYLFPT